MFKRTLCSENTHSNRKVCMLLADRREQPWSMLGRPGPDGRSPQTVSMSRRWVFGKGAYGLLEPKYALVSWAVASTSLVFVCEEVEEKFVLFFYTLVSPVLQEVVYREDSEKNGLGVAPRSCFGVQGGCFLSSLSEGSTLMLPSPPHPPSTLPIHFPPHPDSNEGQSYFELVKYVI